MGPGASLDGCGIYLSLRDSIPGPFCDSVMVLQEKRGGGGTHKACDTALQFRELELSVVRSVPTRPVRGKAVVIRFASYVL